jgi:5-methylcytosine-specific restriction enzyme A
VSPLAPLRPCPVPGCPNLVRERGRCDQHGGPEPAHRWDTDRRPDVKRLAGRPNQERRLRLFAQEPLCRHCTRAGRVTLATIADHIVPLAESGVDDRTVTLDQLEPLCADCHRVKTQAEAARGRLDNSG